MFVYCYSLNGNKDKLFNSRSDRSLDNSNALIFRLMTQHLNKCGHLLWKSWRSVGSDGSIVRWEVLRRKKRKVWNCIRDTPALCRSAGLWKSSLFSLAVLRKSHRALCTPPNNKSSSNTRPDLLFWPCCVFTSLTVQHSESGVCFYQRSAGLFRRLALPWEELRWDAAVTWSASLPLSVVEYEEPPVYTKDWNVDMWGRSGCSEDNRTIHFRLL